MITNFFNPPIARMNCQDIVPEVPIGKVKKINNDKWSFYNSILAVQDKKYGNDQAQAFAKKIRNFMVKPENIQNFQHLYDHETPPELKTEYQNFSKYLESMTIKDKSGNAKSLPIVHVIGSGAAAVTESIIAIYSDSGNSDDVFCPPNFTKDTPVIQLMFDDDKQYDAVMPEEPITETTTTETTKTTILPGQSAAPAPAPAPAPVQSENVVDRLLKKVSCDISDRTYDAQLLQDQQKALEIRKMVLQEIANQKSTPAAKTKDEFNQAAREELLTFVVTTAKEKLPTYEQLAADPTFVKTVKDKLTSQQKTEFDALFKKVYPDLYKVQIQTQQTNQGSSWKWPTFITEEQKTRIKADVKANKDIPLGDIMNALGLSNEQKAEFGTEWGKGLKTYLISGDSVTKPDSVTQSDWDSTIAGIKSGTIKKKKEMKGTASTIDDKLWGKMLQQYRTKTGGATKRRSLIGRRTVRRV
jgi:hypothetical protein